MFYKSKEALIPAKIPSWKNDGAPMLIFFDCIKSTVFKTPIIPVPIRIDKTANGQPTMFFFPESALELTIAEQKFSLNWPKFYEYAIFEFIEYTQKMSLEICKRPVDKEKIHQWYIRTIGLKPMIKTFIEDQTFLMQTLLESLIELQESSDEIHILKKYCDKIIQYLNNRIETNSIEVQINGKVEQKLLFKKRKNKIYPEIIEFDVVHQNPIKDPVRQMVCIPLLVYDDFLECMLANRKNLDLPNPQLNSLKLMKKNEMLLITPIIDSIKPTRFDIESLFPSWDQISIKLSS
jgi:hypothetical protein